MRSYPSASAPATAWSRPIPRRMRWRPQRLRSVRPLPRGIRSPPRQTGTPLRTGMWRPLRSPEHAAQPEQALCAQRSRPVRQTRAAGLPPRALPRFLKMMMQCRSFAASPQKYVSGLSCVQVISPGRRTSRHLPFHIHNPFFPPGWRELEDCSSTGAKQVPRTASPCACCFFEAFWRQGRILSKQGRMIGEQP